MDLVNFAVELGKKVIAAADAPEAAAEKIKKELLNANLGLGDLQVTLNGTDCRLSGTCPDWPAYQKAILVVGNIEGIGHIDAKDLKIQFATPTPEPQVQYYVIQKGDNLSKIAKQFYGDANAYNQIFEANKEVIQHPDKIFPGQKIRIPAK